jgi:2'-hydroxyisoflavone reductase
MDVLVLGGSIFVGRAVVAEALAAGADVTVFNRGRSGAPPARVTRLVGDRTVAEDLAQLATRHYDLVVDTCGYVPADVSAGAAAVDADHYAFISSINVFPGWPESPDYAAQGPHEGDPDATRDDLPAGLDASASYGWLKAGCERAVLRAFGPDSCAILRGGAIVGPHDASVGRLPWWIDRVARGGEVLAPGAPDDPIALIDARDLARFALSAVPGTYEAAGPAGRDSRADLLEACRAVTGSGASFTYVADDWLMQRDVQFWTELPLWIPRQVGPSTFTPNSAPAAAAGLSWRPLAETVADTWAWQRQIPWQPSSSTPGLAPERERDLLAAWHTR